jgi:multidrug efflux pump subunit AcrA (membrane-fusion protein)
MSPNDLQQNQTVQSTSEQPKVLPAKPEVANPDRPASKLPKFLLPTVLGLLLLGGVGWVLLNRVLLPMLMFSQMKPPPPMSVPLANPRSAVIADSSDYAASLDSRQSITLQPRVSGQIAAIYVQAGDRVQAGTPILQIDATEQQAQVSSRQAAVATARAEIETAKAEVNNAIDTLKAQQARRAAAASDVQLNQREYERYQDLYQQGAASKQIVDQRLNALQTAQSTLQQVEADIQAQRSMVNRAKATVFRNQQALQQAQSNVAEGKAQLQYYTIKAPFSGIVGNIPAKVGDFVDTTTQLLTVTQNRELEIQVAIPLEKASALRSGLPVKLLDDQSRVLQTGRISFIAPNVNPATQSVQAKATFRNWGGELRTAQFVRARVIWKSRPGVLVPTSAISRLGGKDFIFVATPFKDSKCQVSTSSAPSAAPGGAAKPKPDQLVADQRLVSLGKIMVNDQEVLKGLSVGDRIVTAGIQQLQNCMPIAEAPASPQSPS